MSIYDFVGYCTDEELLMVVVYSVDEEMIVWRGMADELPAEYGEVTEFSFDVPTGNEITFNV